MERSSSQNSSQLSLNTRLEMRRAKTRLRDFYGLHESPSSPSGTSTSVSTTTTTTTTAAATTTLSTPNPQDLNEKHFQVDLFLHDIFHEKSLLDLCRLSSDLSTDVKSLDGEMKTLVYENYEKFTSATDTIKNIKTKMESIEGDLLKISNLVMEISQNSSL